MLTTVGGCQVDQKKEVDTYRRIVDLDSAFNAAPDPQPDRVTLRDALLLANRNNETLAIRGENYLRALIDRHRAVANFLPTVDLTATQDVRARAGSSEAAARAAIPRRTRSTRTPTSTGTSSTAFRM
jgi:hypothetical protein